MPNAYNSTRWTGPQLDAIYPVGSVYISVNNTNPGTLFGGSWEQIQDKFIMCAGSTYAGGSTGGSITSGGPSNNTSGSTAITVAQMPSHNHRPYILLGGYSGWNNITSGGDNSVYMYKWASDNIYNTNSAAYTDHGTNSPLTITSNTGSGQGHTHTLSSHTHNTTPPYIALYVWQRIA